MSRRKLLGVFWNTMITGVVIAIGPVLGDRLAPSTTDSVTDRLLSIFRRRRSAVIIGKECLRQHPQEMDPRYLLNLLDLSSRENRIAGNVDYRYSLARWLQHKFQEDFKQGRTIRVEGWLLSQTEARLYALAAHQEMSESGLFQLTIN